MLAQLLLATDYVGTIGDLLEYGAPSASDVIAARKGYVVGFNDKTHCPDWTVHRLRAEQLRGATAAKLAELRAELRVMEEKLRTARGWNAVVVWKCGLRAAKTRSKYLGRTSRRTQVLCFVLCGWGRPARESRAVRGRRD